MHTPKDIKRFIKTHCVDKGIESKLMRIYYDNCSKIESSYHMKMFLLSILISKFKR